MIIRTIPCIMCGKTSDVEIPESVLLAWKDGGLLQVVWPDSTPEQRELFISGTHPECWANLTKGL